MIKPGKRDIKHLILITGQELTSLQALTGYMAESYGLDDRIYKYKGKRPIGLYRWDLECLIMAIEEGIKDIKTNEKDGLDIDEATDLASLNSLLQRLNDEETSHYGSDT